ncbi:MAG: PQQ-binding-like beta-propeller repeat protein [bacterium]
MHKPFNLYCILLAGICLLFSFSNLVLANALDQKLANAFLNVQEARQGLYAEINCKNGEFLKELVNSKGILAHGLALQEDTLKNARNYLISQNLYGQVTMEKAGTGKSEDKLLEELPYSNDMVNLLVVNDIEEALNAGLALSEVMRVVCPNGLVFVGERQGVLSEAELRAHLSKAGITSFTVLNIENGYWAKIVKPRSSEMDEWTHWAHDADRTGTSNDKTVTEVPDGFRWLAGPLNVRGHRKTGHSSAIVSSNGRVFILTINESYNLTVPEEELKYFIKARDAYNGLFLWKKEVKVEGDPYSVFGGWTIMSAPLVALGDRVYASTEIKRAVILDAATGELLKQSPELDSEPVSIAVKNNALEVITAGNTYLLDTNTLEIKSTASSTTLGAPTDAEDGCGYLSKVNNFNISGKIWTNNGYAFLFNENGQAKHFYGARGHCRIFQVVANGLVYSLPNACKCPQGALSSEMAIVKKQFTDIWSSDGIKIQGEAYDRELSLGAAKPSDWPIFRNNTKRTSYTSNVLPEAMNLLWSEQIGVPRPDGPLGEDWRLGFQLFDVISAPTVAAGIAFVGLTHLNQVVALDADTHQEKWRYTAGGRIESPPTYYEGRCIFGAADGWVYCLDASDGALIWKYRAAPANTKITAYGQLESVWPVVGSILVKDNKVVFGCGRVAGSDGGYSVIALEADSGELIWEQVMDGEPYNICKSLMSDGQDFFMGQSGGSFIKFDANDGNAVTWGLSPENLIYYGRQGFLFGAWRELVGGTSGKLTHYVQISDGFSAGSHYDSQAPVSGASRTIQLLALREADNMAYGADIINHRSQVSWLAPMLCELFAQNKNASDVSWRKTLDFPRQVEALIVANDKLIVAGANDCVSHKGGGFLEIRSTETGEVLSGCSWNLPSPPAYEGLAAANGKIYVSTSCGKLSCYGSGSPLSVINDENKAVEQDNIPENSSLEKHSFKKDNQTASAGFPKKEKRSFRHNSFSSSLEKSSLQGKEHSPAYVREDRGLVNTERQNDNSELAKSSSQGEKHSSVIVGKDQELAGTEKQNENSEPIVVAQANVIKSKFGSKEIKAVSQRRKIPYHAEKGSFFTVNGFLFVFFGLAAFALLLLCFRIYKGRDIK